MLRVILTYGVVSGVVIVASIIGASMASQSGLHTGVWFGYLIMLVALSSILVGIKQHRDQALGGVITFRTGLLIGLGIAAVASVAYVAVWEVYLALTHYAFIGRYVDAILAAKRAAGVTGAAYAKVVAQMEDMRRQYANPLSRMLITFTEIFPVGFLAALVSAALLRNPRFLPARPRPA
jgi:polyferredoxin